MSSVIFKIETSDKPWTLHVEMTAATQIAFDMEYKGLDYSTVVKDICRAAPHMMSLDSDLMEAYDNAFRTQPKVGDKLAVSDFIRKYKDRLSENLVELFT